MVSGHSRAAVRRLVFGALAGLIVAGCGTGEERGSTRGPISTLPLPPAFEALPEPTTTTEPKRAPTTEDAADEADNKGSEDVRTLQRRLAELGYDVGPIDGGLGGRTAYSIMAFQKVEGLKRTGTDNAEVREALDKASRPGPMVPGGASTRVEIDLNRQVLFLWKGGSLARILPISSGNGKSYCVKGDCDVAVTPPGSFHIGRKATGLEVAPLGELWWPMYFNGGIAIHGSPSVPAYPASHGCIRVPMYAAPTLYDQVDRGTPVILVGQGPGPAGARVVPPPEPPAAPPTTGKKTTTTPPTTETPTTVAPPTTEPDVTTTVENTDT
ncbi:MAG: hypothetical protein QOD63_3152 [Actinomycetota bacterium]|jgi:peptidoglycan hydrolase-like protein with peptidoglycan-binding domain|nr:hypothetical protein [Actinomycetota bacterium]